LNRSKIVAKQDRNPIQPLPTGMVAAGSITGPLDCLLFDIYGTLLISGSGDVGTSMQDTRGHLRLQGLLRKFGIDRSPESLRDDFYAAIHTRHDRLKKKGVDYPEVKIDHIWKQVLNIEDVAKARNFAIAFELMVNPTCPMPGLKQLLDDVRQSRLYMGVISNAQFYTPLILEHFLDTTLTHQGFCEDLVIFSYVSEIAKPSESLFRSAEKQLRALDISPSHALYVGNDMLNDIMPAQKTGFKTALFAGDQRSLRLREEDERCRGVVPDMVITELMQLEQFF